MKNQEAIEKVLNVAMKEVGYLEKKSNSLLDALTGNAGDKNFTKYARDLFPHLQGQPWCDMFVDWCFVQAFGREKAEELLGGFSAYTPTSAGKFQNMKRFFSSPAVGDQIFFRTTERINHTGLVYKIADNRVYTIEGNTSVAAEVIPNGGGVYCKYYDLMNQRIAGYGRPDWGLLEAEKVEEQIYSIGWNKDMRGWWYSPDGKRFSRNEWVFINHYWYYFDDMGYAIQGWAVIDGKKYYFETEGDLECALYRSAPDGSQEVWYVA